jgi:RNA recognition motif-containing protein
LFQVLIGGLRDRDLDWNLKWTRVGEGSIKPFDPKSDDIPNMLKSTTQGGDIISGSYFAADESRRERFTFLNRPSSPTTLMVRGIDGQTTLIELTRVFKKFGKLLDVTLSARMDTNPVVVSASVTMEDLYPALDAEQKLDGYELRGRPIKVSIMRGDSGGVDRSVRQ